MKAHTVIALAVFSLIFSASFSRAQGTFHDTTYSQAADLTPVMGSDFWFTPPQIFATAGQYYQLNITSPKNTIVSIQTGTVLATIKVMAGKTANYSLPLTQIMKTSGIVEEKSCHVWSDSATLDVMLVEDYSTDSAGDGIHILPDFQLGKNYAVASYQAYFVGIENQDYDYPSMFTVTAPYDSTFITIVPTADLRVETEADPNPTGVGHRSGIPFTLRLDHGESVQFKTVLPQDLTSYDLTGTIIRSTYPVAVVGASERAAIPSDYPAHPDFIADMIPPMRSWDTLYYSAPFYQMPGVTGHDASSFAVIGSVPNQSIFITNSSGKHLYATLDHAFDVSIQPDIALASQWQSDAPFLLVQYANAPDYPAPAVGVLGSPAMMVLPPPSQFARSSVVQVPIQNGAYPTQFSSFMNVFVSPKARDVTLDGVTIRSWPKTTLPDGTIVYHNSPGDLLTGAHRLASDAPVDATLYGYSVHSGETIAYPAATGLISRLSMDSVATTVGAPTVAWSLSGVCATATVVDSPVGVSHLAIDSMMNVSVTPDTEFAAGDSLRIDSLRVCVLDTSVNAVFRFIAYDMAGNRTISELDYTAPVKTTLRPGFTTQNINFDTCLVGSSKSLAAVTITDTSSYWPLTVDSIWMDNPVFRDTSDAVPFTIAPQASRSLQIIFSPPNAYMYTSLLHIQTSSAGSKTVTLRGSGYSTSGVAVSGTSPLAQWLSSGTGEAMTLPPAPDPARGSVTLEYALRAPALVTFDLFTTVGTNVLHRSLGAMASGARSTTFSLSGIPPGNYVFRLSIGGEVHSGKLEIR